MRSEGQSVLQVEKATLNLEAYGNDRKEAYGNAFASLKKKAYSAVEGLIIHMEPEDVIVLEEVEQTGAQKVAAYFKPRKMQHFYIKIQVMVSIKYIKI